MILFAITVSSPYPLPTPAMPVVQEQVVGNLVWPGGRYIGTGGSASLDYHLRARAGYQLFVVAPRNKPIDLSKPNVLLMQDVKRTFGRTFSRLTSVFGVSRQTLYNWLDGEVPKSSSQDRLVALSQAARVFNAHRYTPTALDLTRTLTRGKSFLDLMAEGADGQATAEKLVSLIHRGLAARAKLDAVVAGQEKAARQPSDFGAPALDED
jgi:hypothetical protein